MKHAAVGGHWLFIQAYPSTTSYYEPGNICLDSGLSSMSTAIAFHVGFSGAELRYARGRLLHARTQGSTQLPYRMTLYSWHFCSTAAPTVSHIRPGAAYLASNQQCTKGIGRVKRFQNATRMPVRATPRQTGRHVGLQNGSGDVHIS